MQHVDPAIGWDDPDYTRPPPVDGWSGPRQWAVAYVAFTVVAAVLYLWSISVPGVRFTAWMIGFWGLVACVVAIYATNLGPLIDVVNRFGSFFYGSLLGVFVLAIGTKRATGTGAFIGLICGMAAVAFVAFRHPAISFLWHNVVGVVVVVVVGMVISLLTRPGSTVQGPVSA